MIKIDFERETKYGLFRDSITLPEDHTHTEQEIIEMQNERVVNFVAFIDQSIATIDDPNYVPPPDPPAPDQPVDGENV